MATREDMYAEVANVLEAQPGAYDVNAIVDDLMQHFDTFASIPDEEFWDVVEMYELS